MFLLLLLLGLAFLLAIPSSLLSSSALGREDNDGDDSHTPGEISGSVSVSSSGEVWLTTYVERYSILTAIEIRPTEDNSYEYVCSIVGIAELSGTEDRLSLSDVPTEELVFVTSREDDAIEKVTTLVERLGLHLEDISLQAIPHAMHCDWRDPRSSYAFIQKLLEDHEES